MADWAPARILVVDDHPEVLRLVRRQLEPSYRCDVASTAGEARAQLASQPTHLVLCDIYLPGESGLVLAQEIVREFPQTSVVLMTAEDDPEVARRAFDFGVHGYLVKPFGRGQLLITTMNALKRRQLELAQKAHARTLPGTAPNRHRSGADADLRQGRRFDTSLPIAAPRRTRVSRIGRA